MRSDVPSLHRRLFVPTREMWSGLFHAMHPAAGNMHFSQQCQVLSHCPEVKKKKKRLLDPFQLWQITVHHFLSQWNQSCSLLFCSASTWIQLMRTLFTADMSCTTTQSQRWHTGSPPLTSTILSLQNIHKISSSSPFGSSSICWGRGTNKRKSLSL